MASAPYLSVVETPSFLRDAKKLMDDNEREALVGYLSSSPNAGRLIKGTGGVRKLRWAKEDTGKSGAYRIIYFFHSEDIPLFALNAFAKNEKANISNAERNELKQLTDLLVEQYNIRRKTHGRKTHR